MKETYRLQRSILQEQLKEKQQYLVVFIIYTGKTFADYTNIFDKMRISLERLEKIIN